MIKRSLLVTGVLSLVAISFITTPLPAHALDILAGACNGAGGNNAVCDARADDFQILMRNVINTIFVLIGLVATIMVVIGGFRYVTSNGDPNGTTSAKNTILYALIGIAVAVAAFGIVNFVLDRLNQ